MASIVSLSNKFVDPATANSAAAGKPLHDGSVLQGFKQPLCQIPEFIDKLFDAKTIFKSRRRRDG
ncbi:MAG TPA: hypothetical protein VJ001_09475 [Rhodocyclaceae bacterium]|nr:hypothetical protein [Rhodocyclaceae bacterium]